MNNRNRRIITLVVLCLFLVSLFSLFTSNYNNFDNDVNLETSTDNYLFNGKSYPFELNDVYDDGDYTKIYTDAYLQTEHFDDDTLAWNGTVFDDQVPVVNNTNYKSPDTTEYYATHDFREYNVGTEGYDITNFIDYYSAGADTSASIISGIDDHKKVLELDDQSDVGYVVIYHHFDYTEVDSTIEFWLASTSISGYRNLYLYIYDENNANTIRLCLTNNRLRYDDGSGDTTICTFTANEFFHVKLVLDDTADTYDVYVNDDLKIANIIYRVPSTANAYKIYFRTRTGNIGYKIYIDAVAYSGDPDYNVGDNLYPDNIIMEKGSYDNSDNMKSIDSVYSDFDSEGYGDYPGTYSFEDDDVGSNPAGFTITESGSNTINVIAESHGHNKVVEFHDVDDDVKIQNYFTAKTTGTVEWYMKASQINCRNWVLFWPESGNYLFFAGFHSEGTIRYYDGAYVYVCDYAINTWYHFKFEFNSNTKLFSFYLDGVLITGGDEPYVNSDGTDDIASILWQTSNGVGYMFVDAIGMDWDPNYNVGDNEDGDGKLDFTIESSLAMYDDPDLLSLSIISYHGTNVSTPITVSVWNYNTESYEQMWSTTSTSVVENSHSITSNVANYFSGNGELKIKYTGAYSSSDFQLNIDYIEFRITYKMDIIIYKIFYENGIWRYRFKLIGSLHYTDWVVFEVIDPEPNFYAISESELTTRWLLQGAEITPVEDFHDDLVSGYWDLYGVSERYFDAVYPESYLFDNSSIKEIVYTGTHFDVGSQDTIPRGITWDGSDFWIVGTNVHPYGVYKYTSAGVYTGTHFDVESQDIYPYGITWDGSDFWVVGNLNDEVYKYYSSGTYTGTHFDVGTEDGTPKGITWDGSDFWIVGHDNTEIYKYTSAGVYTGTHFDVGTEDINPYGITWDGSDFWVLGGEHDKIYKYTSAGVYTGTHFDIGTEDIYPSSIIYDGNYFWLVGNQNDEVYKYHQIYNNSKNYHGSGYIYMQTNATELLALKSQDYGGHKTLNSGDYFEVDFQTSSDSLINLILLKDGIVNKTLTLSQSGNTNFNRHTIKVSVDELVEFDQLKISGTLEDVDYVKVYDIKTYKYTLTGDYADFYVGSKRDREIYLNPDIYNLRIFEEGDEKINENITIPTTGFLDYVYTPIERLECRLALFNTEGSHLEFTDYHIKVNRSLNGVYNEFWLLDSIFSADTETYAYMSVYDRFDTLIDTFERLTSEYIDLEIEVYSLQIKNLMEQKTTLDINGSYTYPLLSGDSIYFILSKEYYQIGYYDSDNDYHQFTIYLDSNQAYELNRSKICFLSYADQQGNHLFFDSYKTYINGTLIYENVFYEDAGDDVNITITDRYDYGVYQDVYTVVSGDNYIPITLTMYLLKVMNQQENFNHINITRDPNYYESEYYWSEWIAPNEIIEFRLFAGYYKINLTDNENNGYSFYAYTLSGDDILLLSSDNIISNVIYNIENVNTTIGNQITNVQIDLTNQNSAINNSIINIDINLGNINSSIGNLLITQGISLTNIENNISSLYVFTNNSFINLGNEINTSFIYIENNIISINQSISNLVIGVSNDIYLINGTISTMITQMENNLLLMNLSIDTALFDLGLTVEQIGNNITNNYILLNNSITLTNNNINDSRIAIINNLALINNTISNLISQVYSSVYMINNSIYTAVVDVGTSLSLINNSISGNLSIVLQQNDFLTEIYKMTMFSDLLNWTNIGYNSSLIESQIDVWEFINNYRNESITVHLKYQDLIDNLTVSAQNTINQYLPKNDVEYRLWSIANKEYLSEWVELPENRTVNFGFFEDDVPVDPNPFFLDFVNFSIFLMVMAAIGLFGLFLYFRMRYQQKRLNPRVKRKKRKIGAGTYNDRGGLD